jgi:hypothetical protein
VVKRFAHLGIVGAAVFTATAALAQQYQMELTGVGDGVVSDGAYVSPYVGQIVQGGTITGGQIVGGTTLYTGYVICDDYTTQAYLNTPWKASETSAGALNGSQKFTAPRPAGYAVGYTAQQDYDAVAWLANQLVLSQNVTNPTAQIDYSFAIWDIFDGYPTDPNHQGNVSNLISQAFAQVANGYAGTNVAVFTPNPLNATQEFLVVNSPVATPEPAETGLLLLDITAALVVVFLLRRKAIPL